MQNKEPDKPRLLYLVNEALFFTTHRMPAALAAREAGYDVHVAAPYEAEWVQRIKENGFPYYDIPLKRGGQNLRDEWRLFRRFWQLIATVRPVMVHHVAMKPVIYGGIASRLLRVPGVVHAITGLGFLFIRTTLSARLVRALITPLYRFALGHRNAQVIFQNPDDQKLFLDHGLVKPEQIVMIKGCGVDMQQFRPPQRSNANSSNLPVVMFPARLLGDKGVHEFMAAVRQLRADSIPARFVLVGRTDPANPTHVPETTVQSWVDAGLVEWWGYSRDMPATLRQADIICMPSYREGLPRGLIEAAATGLAIVTSDVPGCREVVRDGETGLLVPVRDGPATAAAIKELLLDPNRRQNMGRAGRAFAKAEFSVEHFIAATLNVYATVKAGTRAEPG